MFFLLLNKVLQISVCLLVCGCYILIVFTLPFQAIADGIHDNRVLPILHYCIRLTALGTIFRLLGKFTEAVYRYLQHHLRLWYRHCLYLPYFVSQAVHGFLGCAQYKLGARFS